MNNRIELISTDIIEEHSGLSAELVSMNRSLALSSGWHYIMDWTWSITQMDDLAGKTIVDAGAGIGLLQWYLASQGAHVISVDRSDRTCIPFHLVDKFNVSGYLPSNQPLEFWDLLNISNQKARFASRAKAIVRGLFGQLRSSDHEDKVRGSVQLYNQDLRNLSEIPDNTVDMIVSISALEHNEKIEEIRQIILELGRILRPGGKMIITLPASEKEDWFFAPAYSWCFSEATLRSLFGFSKGVPSNFSNYEFLMEKLMGSSALKKNISWRYFFQPNSGLPWGKWNPKYLPVGIIKTKQD